MPDGLDGRLRWWFGGVAVVLVATGAYALLVSDATAPAQGDAQHAPVAALLAAATITFAVLGVLVVRAPRRRTHLMLALALAPAAAALFETGRALHAWLNEADVATPATIAAASLLLVLAALGGWLALWLAPRPGDATARRDERLLDALLDTIVPAGERVAIDRRDPALRARVAEAFAARSTRRRPLLRLVLRELDLLCRLRHRTSFADADRDTRERLVAGLATSRFARLRALALLLEDTVVVPYWSDPGVRVALGEDPARLEALLDAGPNAAAHRARREAAAQLAAEELAARFQALVSRGADESAPADVARESEETTEVEPAAATASDEQDAASAAPPMLDDEPRGVASRDESSGAHVAGDSEQPAPAAKPAAAAAPRKTTRVRRLDPPQTETAERTGPAELAPPTEDVPFDRPWTLGVPAQEPSRPVAANPVLRVARAGGPTRP